MTVDWDSQSPLAVVCDSFDENDNTLKLSTWCYCYQLYVITNERILSFLALAEPTICKHISKYPRQNSTKYYEYHICPTPDKNGTFIACCGDLDKEYCCNQLSWVYVVVSAGIILASCRQWLVVVVVAAAVVVTVANTTKYLGLSYN